MTVHDFLIVPLPLVGIAARGISDRFTGVGMECISVFSSNDANDDSLPNEYNSNVGKVAFT